MINNATSATALIGTAGDDILIATNGNETLNGGGGNDVLIGNSGSHTMTGGTGNDAFAFVSTSDGPGIITDFNNTTQQDHIVISANGFGGGLTAGMDVTPLFTRMCVFSGAPTGKEVNAGRFPACPSSAVEWRESVNPTVADKRA